MDKEIKLSFYKKDAPKHVANFIKLAEDGFFNGTTFHRVETSVLIQGGDFKSKDDYIYDDGTGQLDYKIESEFKHLHSAGAVAMAKLPAKTNPQNLSNACQFYISLDSLTYLDKEKYTIFAFVEEGIEHVNEISKLETYFATNPNNSSKKTTEMSVEIIYE
jgi:cyclophilin family peptidyl-prolyl cis-trans isomerase